MPEEFELDDAFDRVQRRWIEESPGVFSIPLSELSYGSSNADRTINNQYPDDDILTVLSNHIDIDLKDLSDEEWTEVSTAEIVWASAQNAGQWKSSGPISLANLIKICWRHQRSERKGFQDLWEFINEICRAAQLEVDQSAQHRTTLNEIVESDLADRDELIPWIKEHVRPSGGVLFDASDPTEDSQPEDAVAEVNPTERK